MTQPGEEPVVGTLVRGCRFEEVDVLEREGIQAYRMPYDVGQYMTRLEMASFSIMLLKLNDEMKGYLKAPCNVAARWSF
jgi:dihydroxyacetone kinase